MWLAGVGVTAADFLSRDKTVTLSVTITGLLLIAAGIGLRFLSMRALGRYFTYDLRILPGHRLVTQGVYGLVRHPACTGALLLHIGLPLAFSSIYGFLVTLLVVPCYIYRIRTEERMLVDHFGDEYRRYMRKTRNLVPGIY